MRDIDLMNEYLARMSDWVTKRGEKEKWLLFGALLEWGVAVLKSMPPNTILWDAIQEQIKGSARKTGKSEKELLDYLFESDNHDTWMLRFQMLDTVK